MIDFSSYLSTKLVEGYYFKNHKFTLFNALKIMRKAQLANISLS